MGNGNGSRPKYALLGILLLEIILIYAVSMFIHTYICELTWTNERFHTAIEGFGSFVAISIAVILRIIQRHKKAGPHYLWASCGLLTMGILDAFHASAHPGYSFVWLRTIAGLSGGFFFMLAWLPERIYRARFFNSLPYVIASIATFYGFFCVFFPHYRPLMTVGGKFTPLSVTLNIAGGYFFLASAGRFIISYLRSGSIKDFLFASFCVFMGSSGALFQFSDLWCADWWFWHFLRVAGYIIVFSYAFIEYSRDQRSLQSVNRALMVLSAGNRIVVRAVNESGILQSVCDNIINAGGYRLAWVGYLRDDGRQGVSPVAWSACGECRAAAKDRWPGNEKESLLIAMAAQTGELFISRKIMQDPQYVYLRDGAKKSGYNSFAAIPLRSMGHTLGALSIYASEGDAFDVAELDLLKELADGLAFGIVTLRTRGERDTAAQALGQKEKQYAAMLLISIDGFWVTDMQGRILDVNDAYCRILGYSREELLSMSIKDIEAAEESEDTARHIRKIKELGGDHFETRHRCKDGRIVDIEVSVNYLDIEGGRLFVFLRDITERKKKDEEILRAGILNQTIIQTIPFGMDIADEQGNIMYLSPKLEEIFGKEAIGKKCWELYRDDKKRCEDCPLRKGIEIGQTSAIETDGVLGSRTFQINHTGMIYQGKKAILEIFQDVTEHRRQEEELNLWSAAVRQTADFMMITDKNGLIEYVNPAFTQQTGYAQEEIIGKTPRILKSGKHDNSFYEKLWKAILSGGVFKSVLINKKKNGQLYYSEKTITPIKDADGNITHFISTDKDITERRRYEEELLEANRELLKLDRLKSDFIANVSHELRTPLAMIKEGISQVSEGLHGKLEQEQKYFLDKSLDNINRLAQIINSILEVSKLEAGKIELKKEEADIVDLAAKAVSLFSPQAKSKGLEIKAVFPSGRIEIRADSDRISQVFSNLIENAVKFTDSGVIEVKILDKGDAVECNVSDTGRGMSGEDLLKVFDKFQQFGRGYGPGAKGVGLGLAITKAIVELHNGKIWAESSPGKGSRFAFSLPKG